MATYGIDLGTTYSCIAKLDEHGNPVVIKNQADDSDTLASAVYFESESNVIVGNAAKDMVETDGARVVEFAKRYIGKSDPETMSVVQGWNFDGKSYTPVEISSLILQRLKGMAEEQGEDVKDVVITCPAYFGIEERNATKTAGELSGLNVLNIINEPTAAALSYCARQFQEERTILVYDLGGGTFDVTIMKMSMEQNEAGEDMQKMTTVATGGNDLLGGKDWDDILYSMIESACCEENGLTPEDLEPETRQQIRGNVEKTKKKLSNMESAKVKIVVNGAITNVVVTREEFEQQTAGKVAQTMTYVEDVMQKAGNPALDMVLLVGGSTFMPMIRQAVEARFEGIPVNIYEPNMAVAKGAAVYAGMLVDESETQGQQDIPAPGSGTDTDTDTVEGPICVYPSKPRIDIEDQLPRSFGPGVLNEQDEYIIDNLIKQGTTCPADVEREYYTPKDNMTMIRLKVFESMSLEEQVVPSEDGQGNPLPANPADNVKYLGKLEMELPAGVPAGASVMVTFHADMTGIQVHTLVPHTGTEAEAMITFATQMTQEQKQKSAVHGLRVDGE